MARLVRAKMVASIAMCAAAGLLAAPGSSVAAGANPSAPTTVDARQPPGRAMSTVGLVVGLDFYMAARNSATLTRFITAVSTPGSTSYHHYLRKGEFASRFGATRSTITRLSQYLKGNGLSSVATSPDHLFIHATGPVSTVDRLLRTTIRAYDDHGHRVYRDLTPIHLPRALAQVKAVVGLTDVPQYRAAYTLGTRARPRTTTCAQMSVGTNATSGPFTIGQIGNIYKFNAFAAKGAGGQGQTVAIFELTNYLPSDIKYFQDCTGGKHDTISSIVVDGGNGISPYAEVEADLDIEVVATLAPYATIDVYQGPNSESGVVDTYDRIAIDDAAKVVSTSWGLCEGADTTSVAAESGVFQEMAAQGQTVAAAAGDNGASDCLGLRPTRNNPLGGAIGVDDPASQPYVTGVGGTTVTDAATVGTDPSSQVVWDSNDLLATGGGVSSIWPSPSYQHGVPGASSGGRTVPDVAMNADPASGYMIYSIAYGWVPIGGTSAAAPLFASLMALANQYNATTYGFVLPLLYGVGKAEPGKYFTDVTEGNNKTYDVPGFSSAGPGFDAASGWGSPIGSQFLSLIPPA